MSDDLINTSCTCVLAPNTVCPVHQSGAPCPHGRPYWGQCPHCMGVEGPKPPYMTSEAVKAVAAMSVVPMNSHGAQVEWHINGSDLEIEFNAFGEIVGVCWSKA